MPNRHPTGPTAESAAKPVGYAQLDSIETESQHLFGSRTAIYETIGRPATRHAASQILIAINKLTYGATVQDLKEALENMGETIDLVEPVTTKTCSKCGNPKPAAEFSKNRNNKDGLQNWCKECTSLAHQERKNREANGSSQRRPTKVKASKKPKAPKPDRPARLADGEDHFALASGPAPEPAASNGTPAFRDPPLSKLRELATFFGTDLEGAAHICSSVTVEGGAVRIRGDAA